jgi:hypothetical protein
MKAILIAPDKEAVVQAIDIDGELQTIRDWLDCHLIDCIRLDERGNVMYVDDEGYMNKNYFFRFGEYPQPIAGRGLVLGTNMMTGDSADTDLNFNLIAQNVEPMTPAEAYQMAKTTDNVNKKAISDNNEEAWHIYISVSEIMETSWYSDQLNIE